VGFLLENPHETSLVHLGERWV